MKIKFCDNMVFDCSLRLYDATYCSLGENILPDIECGMKHIDDDLYECVSTSVEFIDFYRWECASASSDPDFDGDVLIGLSHDQIADGFEWVFDAVEEVL